LPAASGCADLAGDVGHGAPERVWWGAHAAVLLRFQASDTREPLKGGCDVPPRRMWARLLGSGRAVVENVVFDEHTGTLVVAVRAKARERDRCGEGRRRCPGYDQGEGRRRWRALDLGTTFCFLEAEAPRVSCEAHGVIVTAFPWARHDSWFTSAFEDQVAWLAVNTSKTAVAQLMGIAWRTVGSVCEHVMRDAERQHGDRLDGLRRLGFDEISIRKGQRHLTVVVDHDTGRLVSGGARP
jgi:transposase